MTQGVNFRHSYVKSTGRGKGIEMPHTPFSCPPKIRTKIGLLERGPWMNCVLDLVRVLYSFKGGNPGVGGIPKLRKIYLVGKGEGGKSGVIINPPQILPVPTTASILSSSSEMLKNELVAIKIHTMPGRGKGA